MKTLAFILAISISTHSLAQKEPTTTKWDLGFEGMVAVSLGENIYGFNVGGPHFSLRLNKNLKFGVGALPSLYVKDGKPGAKLSVGPRLDYRKLVLIAPAYYFESSNKWIWTLGLGYKFHGK